MGIYEFLITSNILALYCFHDDIHNAAGPRPPADTNDLIEGADMSRLKHGSFQFYCRLGQCSYLPD
jgi:hypothetical protein